MDEGVKVTESGFWADSTNDVALQRYQTLVSTLDDGLCQIDADGYFVAVNDVLVDATGYAREDLLGAHVSLILDDTEIDRFEQAIRGLVENDPNDVSMLELSVETADGNRLFWELRLNRLEVNSEFRGIVGVARDITDRKQREQTLEHERELLNRVFEASPIGITALAPDGEVITLNSRASEIVGVDPDDPYESYEASDWEVYDADGELLPPEEQAFNQVVETGEPVTDFEAQVERRDGGRVWLSFNGIPVFDSDGELSLVVLTYEDITELKEREQHLQRERSQTEKLLQTAPVAIAVQDAEGETVMANQRAQTALGLSEQELIEEPEDADEWGVYSPTGEPLAPDETPTALARATGEPVFDEEIVIERPNGERMWFRNNAAPVFGPDGTLERVISAGEDITELKKRESQLERRKDELESELSEILGRISDAFYAFDDEWRFTHVNEHAEEILQYTEAELLDRSVWDLFPEATEGIFWEKFHTAMETQEPVNFEMYAEEFDAWLEFNAYPSETGLSIYFRNVTDRVEREQALEDRERELTQYETIVETINDGIYVVDENGRFEMVNEAYAELTGYDREELLGEHASLVVDEEVLDKATELREAMVNGDVANPTIEGEARTADGEQIPVEGTFAVLPTASGEHTRIGVVRDVSERMEQQRKLEESERRYRALVEHFPNGAVALFDEDLRYTAAGGQLLDATGVDPADRVGQSLLELYPEDIIEEIEPYFHAALEGEANSFEVDYLDRHLLAYTLPIRNADNEVYAGMLVVQDITGQKRVEQELRESEAKSRMLAENLEEIVWMATPDAEEFIYINPAFEDVWELERETLYDEPLAFLEAVHSDDRERVQEAWGQLPDEEYEEEFRIVRPDGELRWIHAHASRVHDESGEVTRIVGIAADITERKESERELGRALDLLDKTERIADVGGWEIDMDTMEVFWTDHIFELLEVPTDEEPSLDKALDMYHEDDRQTVNDAIENALDSGDSFDVEAQIRTHSGELRWLRLQGVPETVDDDIISLRGAAQDITERKEREQQLEKLVEQLEESNERLEQFAYAASHDLQEPLRMVSSYLQLVDRRYGDKLDEDGSEFLEFAVDGADRMREMIDGLLKYARVETQGSPLEPVNLETVLEDVRTDLQLQIDESNTEIEVESLPCVQGDAGQLHQVFQNLLSNAIEYSGDEPPRVHVAAEQTGKKWTVSISDEGVGIDPDDADRIFEVFQSLHGPDEHDGTGIGLALAERIIERHGGNIWVESEPSEGATFSFTLPAVHEAEGDHDE